jgi:hypothetical protein
MPKSLRNIAQEYEEAGWKVEFTPSGSMQATKPLSPVTIARLMTMSNEVKSTHKDLSWGQRVVKLLSVLFVPTTPITKTEEEISAEIQTLNQEIDNDKSWKEIKFDAIFLDGPWDGIKKPLPQPCNRLVVEGNDTGHYMAIDWDRKNDQHQTPDYGGLVIMKWFSHARAIEFTKEVLLSGEPDEHTIITSSN